MRKLIVLLAIAPSLAIASDWALLDINHYIDKNSISTSGKYMKAWFSHTNASPEDMPIAPFKKYLSSKMLRFFNCEERTSSGTQMLYYSAANASGEYLGAWRINASQMQFDEVAPDTLGERDLEYVCAHRKPGKSRAQ
jgi:hypothetical protein